MIAGLDHVVVLVRDLDASAAAFEVLSARAPAWRAADDGAASMLFTLDNMSVELMAPEGDGVNAQRIRNVLDTQSEGLASLCFLTPDIAKMHRRLERLALQPDPVASASSRDIATGATLSWQRSRAAKEATRNVRMFFLELAAPRAPSLTTAPSAFLGLDHVVVQTGDPERAAALYGARLGLDMALDRSNPDWGRLMFFRCGDLIVEVVHRPGNKSAPDHDKIWGLSWRVADADAARARLVAAGIDVSDVRTGRKPGTRVLSVRSGTSGIPTMLVERTARG